MRRLVLGTIKVLTVGLLLAAAFDLRVPGGRRPRVRAYLLDTSASVRVQGGPESIDAGEAWTLAAADARRFDRVWMYEIGSVPRLLVDGSPSVTPEFTRGEETDLTEAIETALVRLPEDCDADIVLLSDGRATAGDTDRALLAADAREVPIHTVGIGPIAPGDARIVRVEGPSFVSAGESAFVDVEVESEVDGTVAVGLDGKEKSVTLVRKVPRRVRFPIAPSRRTEFEISVRAIDFPDACRENDAARWIVSIRSENRRVLVLSSQPSAAAKLLRAQPGFEVTETPSDPYEFDLVVLDNRSARDLPHDRLHSFVTQAGGGLLMLGGPESYGPGGYAGTRVEELLPVWAFPDETLAIVFALDCSGSMGAELPTLRRRKIDAAKRALESVLGELRPADLASLVTFPSAESLPLSTDRKRLVAEIRKKESGGPTVMLPSLEEAVKLLEAATAPRKHLLLLTDGVTEEEPERFEGLRADLDRKRIGLTCVLTGDQAGESIRRLGPPVPVEDWATLASQLEGLLAQSREPFAAPAAEMRPTGHPMTEGIVRWARPDRIHRVSLKPAAELAVACGDDPVLAFRTAGRGRTAAATFAPGWMGSWSEISRLLAQVAAWLAPGTLSPYRLSATIEGPHLVVSASGPEDGPEDLTVTLDGDRREEIRLVRTSRTSWEARVPRPSPGTTYVRLPPYRGATAAVHVPYTMEYRSLGRDEEELERIAVRTGGVFVRGPKDLEAGPARRRLWKSGRPFFLVAALAFFFLDLAVSTFWRPTTPSVR